MSKFEIKKSTEGYGPPLWDIYIDGALCGFSKRKWIAEKIGKCISDGHIPATGDTTTAWVVWAAKNDVDSYNRLPESINDI